MQCHASSLLIASNDKATSLDLVSLMQRAPDADQYVNKGAAHLVRDLRCLVLQVAAHLRSTRRCGGLFMPDFRPNTTVLSTDIHAHASLQERSNWHT